MKPEQFQTYFANKLQAIKNYVYNEAPIHVGKIAVDHFHDNFHKGGYVDETFTPWVLSKRIGVAKGASGEYGPLLSHRKELYNSIRSEAGVGSVRIISSLPYSKIHNEGGTIQQNVPITKQMRKFAWAKYYETEAKESTEANIWKGLALTKKTLIQRTITIPQRQFMGYGKTLKGLIYNRVYKDFEKILN